MRLNPFGTIDEYVPSTPLAEKFSRVKTSILGQMILLENDSDHVEPFLDPLLLCAATGSL